MSAIPTLPPYDSDLSFRALLGLAAVDGFILICVLVKIVHEICSSIHIRAMLRWGIIGMIAFLCVSRGLDFTIQMNNQEILSHVSDADLHAMLFGTLPDLLFLVIYMLIGYYWLRMQHLIYNTANEWMLRIRVLMAFTVFAMFIVWLGLALLFWYSSSTQMKENLKVFQLFFDGSISIVVVACFLIGARLISRTFDPQRRLFLHALKESRKFLITNIFLSFTIVIRASYMIADYWLSNFDELTATIIKIVYESVLEFIPLLVILLVLSHKTKGLEINVEGKMMKATPHGFGSFTRKNYEYATIGGINE